MHGGDCVVEVRGRQLIVRSYFSTFYYRHFGAYTIGPRSACFSCVLCINICSCDYLAGRVKLS